MRQQRRHHRERLKKARASHWGGIANTATPLLVIDTPTPCSCWMCGNPRRHFGEKTIQERRAEQPELWRQA